MKNFLNQIPAFFNDLFEKLRLLTKKQIIIIAAIVAAIVLAIVLTVTLTHKSNDPLNDYKTVADTYCEQVMKYEYYDSLNYTLFAVNGIDKYFDYYMADLADTELTEQDNIVIDEVTDVFKQDIINYVSYNGFTDFDGFLTWYFDKALTVISTYEGEDYMKKGVVLGVLQKTLDYYASTLETENQKKYAEEGYAPTFELLEEKDFSEDEVQKYISNKAKNEGQLLAFEKSGVDTGDISAVKKMTYSVTNNGSEVKQIVFYLVQVNSKWVVDVSAFGMSL